MEISRLIENIYDAAGDAGQWPRALLSIADAYCATDAAIYSALPGETRLSRAVSGRLSDDVHRQYLIEYADRDRQILRLLKRRRDAEITGCDLLGSDEQQRCPVHHEYLFPNNISSQIVWLLNGPDGERNTFVLMRDENKGDFDEETRRAMRVLARHVKRSLSLGRALAVQNAWARAAEDTLDAAGAAIVERGQDGSILRRNAAAEQLLSHSEHAPALISSLPAVGPEEEGRGNTVRRQTMEQSWGAVCWRDPSSWRSYLVKTYPARFWSDYGVVCRDNASTIIVFRPIGGRSEAHQSHLRELFGLSSAESELAVFLKTGGSINEYAALRGRSIHTVRNQLKALMAKTGATRQSQLVSFLLNIPEAERRDER